MSAPQPRHDQKVIWSQVARERDRLVAPRYIPLWERMLDVVGAGPGLRLLDAGCGSGGACAIAARRGAVVTGVDLSDQMIAVCREKTELTGCTFEVGSLEALALEDASFDAVIASMVLHFCASSERALRELRRVLIPSGRIAVSSPASPDLDLAIAFQVAAELCPDEADDIRRMWLFAPAGKLVGALEAAEFREVAEEFVDLTIGPMPFEEVWALQKCAAPLRTAVERVGEGRFLAAYRPRIRHCLASGDVITLSFACRIVSSRR
jgi:ubiquinone/menaquinone biosynthesis C-methylase UbiE